MSSNCLTIEIGWRRIRQIRFTDNYWRWSVKSWRWWSARHVSSFKFLTHWNTNAEMLLYSLNSLCAQFRIAYSMDICEPEDKYEKLPVLSAYVTQICSRLRLSRLKAKSGIMDEDIFLWLDLSRVNKKISWTQFRREKEITSKCKIWWLEYDICRRS